MTSLKKKCVIKDLDISYFLYNFHKICCTMSRFLSLKKNVRGKNNNSEKKRKRKLTKTIGSYAENERH